MFNIEDIINDILNEEMNIIKMDEIETIQDALQSNEAAEFTEWINNYFAKNNIKDNDGNILELTTPTLNGKIIEVENGIAIELSDNDDKWFRANMLFGDLFRNIGITYGE